MNQNMDANEMDFSGSEVVTVKELKPVLKLLKEVQVNLDEVKAKWKETKSSIISSTGKNMLSHDDVIVSKSLLNLMNSQCEQTRQLLPQISNSSRELIEKAHNLALLEQDCKALTEEREVLTLEVSHWKSQLDEAVGQAQKDKQASLNLQIDLQDLTDQLCDQSEFCSGLGSTLATVLWKVSRQEEAVFSIVKGSKLADLLTLTSSCIKSFQDAYKDDQWPEQTSVETNFILALTGTFTNLAASAVGREDLSTLPEGNAVVNTFLNFLSEASSNQTASLKSLMLTGLYNLSINQKGVKYLCSQPQLIATLTAILQSDVADHQAITLRLLMSLIAEEDGLTNMLLQLKETMPKRCLESLATRGDAEVKQLALELLSDIRQAENEP